MSFQARVVGWIKKIPQGKVASYGQIAALAGSPRAAIAVGQILHRSGEELNLPWQRVINAQRYISTTCLEHPAELQAMLLKGEGVETIKTNSGYKIDLSRHRWYN